MNEVKAIKSRDKIEKIKRTLWANSRRDYLMFVMGINMGVRITDLLQLKFKDVLGQTSVKIKEKKTKKMRTVTLNVPCQMAIKEYLMGLKEIPDEDSYIFASRRHEDKYGPISSVQAWRIISDACKKAGLRDIGTHSMRKTFGYFAYENGIDLSTLQKLFNHSCPSITLRYIGITEEQIQDVYNKINL